MAVDISVRQVSAIANLNAAVDAARPLADWERRLLEKARELRRSRRRAILIVTFDGPAMCLSVGQDAGMVVE